MKISKHKMVEGPYESLQNCYRVILYNYPDRGKVRSFGSRYKNLEDANLVAEYITEKGFPEYLTTKDFNASGIRGSDVCDLLILLAKSHFNELRR